MPVWNHISPKKYREISYFLRFSGSLRPLQPIFFERQYLLIRQPRLALV